MPSLKVLSFPYIFFSLSTAGWDFFRRLNVGADVEVDLLVGVLDSSPLASSDGSSSFSVSDSSKSTLQTLGFH